MCTQETTQPAVHMYSHVFTHSSLHMHTNTHAYTHEHTVTNTSTHMHMNTHALMCTNRSNNVFEKASRGWRYGSVINSTKELGGVEEGKL